MTTIDPTRWKALGPHLDQLLELPEAERPSYVAALRSRDPVLGAELAALLDAHRAAIEQRFLDVSPVPPSDPFVTTGQSLGPYRLLSQVGQGGMGSVWLAERTDGRFERRVAIKFLNIGLIGRGGEQRFRREGSLLARLTHPNIAQLIDAGMTANGQPYLVLEHVDGEPIDDYCDRNLASIDTRLQLFLEVAAAVSYAHAQLVVHRDLKPSNVLVTGGGEVKLLDFGIAKLLEDGTQADALTMLTRDGTSALTPECAAPEQVTGGAVSTATDVYALGVLLYMLLSGRHPAGEGLRSTADLVRAIVDTDPKPMSDAAGTPGPGAPDDAAANAARRGVSAERLQRRLRGDVDTIVRKALKKDPRERYPSVAALADDVRRFLAYEPISARPDTLGYRAVKFARRNRVVVALTTLAAAAVVSGVAGTVSQARNARAQRDFALRQLARVEAVNDLNQFVLSDAAPSGKPFTVNELLARAERIVARQRTDDDIRVGLLVAIGRQYWSQDEDDRARHVLTNAFSLSRTLRDPSTRARAACALASALSRSTDLPQADTLVREGLAELPDEPQYALDRVFCLLRASSVARDEGAAQRAVELVESARRELQAAPLRSAILELRVLMDVAETYRVADRHGEATAAFAQAAARLTELGRDQTATAGTLYNNWALTLNTLGRPLEAEPIYRRAIELSRVDATDAAVSPMLLVNYARTLRDLGRLDEAALIVERSHAKARTSGNDVVINQSLLLRAAIYREQDRLTEAAATFAEVEPRLRNALPPGHVAFASLTSEKAVLAQAEGDLPGALALSNRAVDMVRVTIRAGGEGATYLPTFLVRRSDIELDLGQFNAAAADARSAVDLLQDATPAGLRSSKVGRAYLLLGRALQAQGKLTEADAALRTAVQHLEDAAGVDHPYTLSALRLIDAGAGLREGQPGAG
jgi:eukaryotic-like serine/threonine-protein kinase